MNNTMKNTMFGNIQCAKRRVADILERQPRTRSDDQLLYLVYLKRHHDLIDVIGADNTRKLYHLMKTAACSETIRRSRQHIQERGFFQAPEAVQKERDAQAEEMRQNISTLSICSTT